MGLTVNYIMPDGENVENAYLRIQKIVTTNLDYEFLKPSDKDDVESETSWLTRVESSATIYVWVDESARINRVQPIHWFNFNFDFDLKSDQNIYQQVYEQINKKFDV